MQKGPELVQLFPTPLFIAKYPRDMSKELGFIKNLEYRECGFPEHKGDILNHQSKETFLFDYEELSEIEKFCSLYLNYYVENILQCKDKLFITQCWANITRKGERHHEHSHPNSIVSGVFYFQNNSKLPPIQFKRGDAREFQLSVAKHNNFNSSTYLLPADSGELLLFPSTLQHSVLNNQSDEDRISIAFNTFSKGSLGSIESLTYLPIDRCKE